MRRRRRYRRRSADYRPSAARRAHRSQEDRRRIRARSPIRGSPISHIRSLLSFRRRSTFGEPAECRKRFGDLADRGSRRRSGAAEAEPPRRGAARRRDSASAPARASSIGTTMVSGRRERGGETIRGGSASARPSAARLDGDAAPANIDDAGSGARRQENLEAAADDARIESAQIAADQSAVARAKGTPSTRRPGRPADRARPDHRPSREIEPADSTLSMFAAESPRRLVDASTTLFRP